MIQRLADPAVWPVTHRQQQAHGQRRREQRQQHQHLHDPLAAKVVPRQPPGHRRGEHHHEGHGDQAVAHRHPERAQVALLQMQRLPRRTDEQPGERQTEKQQPGQPGARHDPRASRGRLLGVRRKERGCGGVQRGQGHAVIVVAARSSEIEAMSRSMSRMEIAALGSAIAVLFEQGLALCAGHQLDESRARLGIGRVFQHRGIKHQRLGGQGVGLAVGELDVEMHLAVPLFDHAGIAEIDLSGQLDVGQFVRNHRAQIARSGVELARL